MFSKCNIYYTFQDLQLTALKSTINIKKVLPIDGQPIYTCIRKIAQFCGLGAVFSVGNIFTYGTYDSIYLVFILVGDLVAILVGAATKIVP